MLPRPSHSDMTDIVIPTEVEPASVTSDVTQTLSSAAEHVHVLQLEPHQVRVVQLVVVAKLTANYFTSEFYTINFTSESPK